jgi:hypothetical protein
VLTATLRKGHRDLPVLFDELKDALEGHEAEECISAPRGQSPVTMRRSEVDWRKRDAPAIKIPRK